MDTVAATRERVLAARSDQDRLEGLIQLASALYEYDATEAVKIADEAILLAESRSDRLSAAWARHHRAWALSSLGRLDEALTEQMEVFAEFERHVEVRGIGHTLMAIGDLHGDAGDTSTALDYLERASVSLEAAGDELGRGVVLNLTAIALSYEQRHKEAAFLFEQAEQVFQSLNDPVRVPMTKINRGFELLAMAESAADGSDLVAETEKLAAEVIERGLELGDDGRNTVAYGRSLLARVYAASNRRPQALIEAEAAQEVAFAGGFDWLGIEIGLDRSGWLTLDGRLDEAQHLLEKMAAVTWEGDNRRATARAAELKADILEKRGDHAGALAAYREYHHLEGALHTDAADRRARLTAARLQLEGARRETQLAQLRVAELEALDNDKRDFLASVSHELRTPLAAVLGFATELAESWDRFDTDEARAIVGLIARQSADIASIVDDLLTITRVEAGTMFVYPTTIDAIESLAGMVDSLGREAGREVPLNGDAMLWADPTRLRQIVRNLVTNAFRYGGPQIHLEVIAQSEMVAIEVRDSGGPIPPPRVSTMFEPFDHADDRGRTPNSVGLGLAVARSLARMMGGDLMYAYEDSESVFRLTLPQPPVPG